jgi:hypothetical protein
VEFASYGYGYCDKEGNDDTCEEAHDGKEERKAGKREGE